MSLLVILILSLLSFDALAAGSDCHAGDACDQSLIKQYLQKISEFEICPQDSTAVYCSVFGNDEKVDIPEKQIVIVNDKKMSAVGSCPAPLVLDKYHLSYQPFCDFSVKVRDFILAAFSLSSLFIVASSVLRGI